MKLRILINLYMALQVFAVLTMGMSMLYYDVATWIWVLVCGSAFASLIVGVSMGNVEWHQTREEMIEDQKESIRMTSNASKLIDVVKRKAFAKDIISKKDANAILNRTFEEVQTEKYQKS